MATIRLVRLQAPAPQSTLSCTRNPSCPRTPPHPALLSKMERTIRTSVTFKSNNLAIAAMLYVPDDYDGRRLPAVVVGDPAGKVKEQTAGRYPEELSRKGFAALASTPPIKVRALANRGG